MCIRDSLQGSYLEAEPPELGAGEAIRAAIPADPNVKNYTYLSLRHI